MGRSSSVQEWWRLFTCSYWNLFSTLNGGNRSAFVYFGNSFPFFFSLGDPSPTGDQGYFGEKRSCFTPSLSLSSPSSWLTTLWVFSPLFFIFLIDSWILLKIWKQKQKTLKEQRDCVCVCVRFCASTDSSGLEQDSMEGVLVGCIGDVWELLVLRRRRTGRLYLLLCWLLAAHTTAHGEWGVYMPDCCLHPAVCVCVWVSVRAVLVCVSVRVSLLVAADLTIIGTFVALLFWL